MYILARTILFLFVIGFFWSLFLLRIALVVETRQAHIKLRHFHFEHEFSIIIKMRRKKQRIAFIRVYMNYMTPCVRAANNYLRIHTTFSKSLTSWPLNFFSLECKAKVCLWLEKQQFDHINVSEKRASSQCL